MNRKLFFKALAGFAIAPLVQKLGLLKDNTRPYDPNNIVGVYEKAYGNNPRTVTADRYYYNYYQAAPILINGKPATLEDFQKLFKDTK